MSGGGGRCGSCGGVGASTPITCDAVNGATPTDDVAPASDNVPFEELAPHVEATFRQMEADCAANTKPAGLLDHVDTVSVARDLDVLRALSGNEKLDYLGASYGTYLGAYYAELFPANTGRMVLDGALDPSLSQYERRRGQAQGFEQALRNYVDWCQAGQDCPLTGGTDAGIQQVRDLIASADQSPLPTSDPNRPVTGTEIRSAIMYSLYGDERTWGDLTSSLDEAVNRRGGSPFRQTTDQTVADVVHTAAVREAISCLDYPVDGDMAVWSARHQEIRREAPVFGGMAASVDLSCQAWGRNGTHGPTPIRAQGASPILVVGSTGDPATRRRPTSGPDPWLNNSTPAGCSPGRATGTPLMGVRSRARRRWTPTCSPGSCRSPSRSAKIRSSCPPHGFVGISSRGRQPRTDGKFSL